jgi:hypothetical protein
MRIFVGFGFNGRDRWISDMVFPLVEAFGDSVITGEAMFGEVISEEVKTRIRRSNAYVGFLTRRPDGAPGETHMWVIQELAFAVASGLRVVEIRETGVHNQAGMLGDRSRITYDEARRDECLVSLVKTLGNWHKEIDVQLQLLPEEYAQELFPLHRKQDLRCTYRLRVDGEAGPEIQTRIEPIGQGLFVGAKNVPRQALVQVRIEYQGKNWTSAFESVDSIAIRLQKEI